MTKDLIIKYTPKPRIFENGMLRLTQPGRLNDPDDARPELSFGKFSPEDYARACAEAERSGAASITKKDLEALFMTPFPSRRYDEKNYPGLWPAKEPRLRPEPFRTLDELDRCVAERAVELCLRVADQQIGVISLTESTDETMWSYYASSNRTGVAIYFDRNHPFFSTSMEPIDYSDSPIFVSSNLGWVRLGGVRLSNEDILNQKITDIPSNLFFRKTKKWQHEQEWRIVQPLSAANHFAGIDEFGFGVFLFEIPPESVKLVMFDYRASESDIEETARHISQNKKWAHVEIHRRRRTDSGRIEKTRVR